MCPTAEEWLPIVVSKTLHINYIRFCLKGRCFSLSARTTWRLRNWSVFGVRPELRICLIPFAWILKSCGKQAGAARIDSRLHQINAIYAIVLKFSCNHIYQNMSLCLKAKIGIQINLQLISGQNQLTLLTIIWPELIHLQSIIFIFEISSMWNREDLASFSNFQSYLNFCFGFSFDWN